MVYRDVKDDDASALDDLLTKLIEDETKYDPSVEKIKVKDFYINYTKDESKHFIVVEDKNNIVAYTYLIKEDDNLKVDALYVSEDYRNKGIATNILKLVIDYAKDNNFKSVSISVLENNINAKNLYLKFFKVYKKDGIKEYLKMYL